jgi:hypothetical protein
MSIEIADLKRVDKLWAPTQPYRVVSRSSIKDKYLIKEDGGKWLNIRK